MDRAPPRWCVLLLMASGGCAAVTRELPVLECGERSEIRPKLLFLAIDGVRSDAFERAKTPVLDRLAEKGTLRLDTRGVDVPKSGPGWATIFTGVWRDRHRVDSNAFISHDLDEHPDLIARLERSHPELTTSFVHSWPPLHRFALSADHRIECFDSDRFDECAIERALFELERTDVDLLVLYLRSVDETGHEFGFHPSVREYVKRIEWVDRAIGSLIDRIERRCSFARERWLVLAVTDHGGGGGDDLEKHGTNAPIEREVFSLLARLDGEGSPIRLFPAPAQTDFVPTALAHFGVRAYGLDGRVLEHGERPAPRFGENLIFNGGAELDRGQDTLDVDGVLTGWEEEACGAPIATGEVEGTSGKSFIAGASKEACSIRQRIDVSSLDLDGATYHASALLGGWSNQEDAAEVVIDFGEERVSLGPVTAQDRGGRTMLRRVSKSGAVPPGTVEIVVEVRFTVERGRGDGYADDLSLILRRAP